MSVLRDSIKYSWIRSLLLVWALGCVACSARTVVSEVTGVAPGEFVSGVPFRKRAPYTLRVFKKQADDSYKQIHQQHQELADMDRVYALNFDAKGLSNHTMTTGLRPDGTLANMNLTSDIRLAETLTSAGNAGTSVTDAVIAAKQAKVDRETAAATAAAEAATKAAAGQVASEDALIAAQKSLHAANAALRALEDLNTDSPPAAIATAEEAADEAMYLANVMHRRALLPEPFPGVFPK